MNGETATVERGSLFAGIICPGEGVRKGREVAQGRKKKLCMTQRETEGTYHC
jgi:hypothetical protein